MATINFLRLLSFTTVTILFLLMLLSASVLAIRTDPQPLPSNSAASRMSSVDTPVRQDFPYYRIASRILMKGHVTPSGPSHRGNSAPSSRIRHLLTRRTDTSSQDPASVPSSRQLVSPLIDHLLISCPKLPAWLPWISAIELNFRARMLVNFILFFQLKLQFLYNPVGIVHIISSLNSETTYFNESSRKINY